MLTNTVTLEEIHDFFENTLSEEDSRLFEQYITEHPAFAEQLMLYRHLYEGHQDEETRVLLERQGWQIASIPILKTKKRVLIGLAVSLAVLATALTTLLW